jgi:DNA-binding transcriptional LysR family regulator
MDERQLRVLRELGELGSVTAVADALFVTPSAISQQLRLLQRTIAVPLTERDGRRVVLTAAGRALADAAVGVETALAGAREAVDRFVDDPSSSVSVAAFHSAAAAFFPALVRAAARPGGSQIELADEDVAQGDFPALTRDYDVVLAHRLDHSRSWPSGLTVTPLLHEPLDVALPRAHPLAAKAHLGPRDVAGFPWITVHDGYPLGATIEAIAAAAGRPIAIAHRINDFIVAADVVAAGGGLALMPRWTTRYRAGVVLRPLTGVRARRHIDALCRPERAVRRAVADVLAELRRTADAVQPQKRVEPRSARR